MTKLNYLFSLLCMLAISTFAFAQPANDSCADAIDLSASLGQGAGNIVNAGTYDNTGATTGLDDPTAGYECFGEPDGGGATPSIETTVWFKVTGDGNLYAIEATSTGCSVSSGISDNDTQIAIYSGGCNGLTPVTCNEDGPNAVTGSYPALAEFTAEAGVEYLIMVDGFSFNGANSVGEFCLFIEQQDFVACTNPNISGGTASSPTMVVCEGELTAIAIDGALAPNEGAVSGYAWLVSTTDLQGNPDFAMDAGFIGGFAVSAEPVSPLTFDMSSFGGTSMTGTYYFTMAVIGNATWGPDGQTFITQAVLDAACTTLSNSVQIDYYETEFCPIDAVLSVDESVLGMTVFPNPAQDVINLNINAVEYTEATIMITNIAGQMVQQQTVNLANGANVFSMDMSSAATGVYMISIETGSHQSVTRFLKQ